MPPNYSIIKGHFKKPETALPRREYFECGNLKDESPLPGWLGRPSTGRLSSSHSPLPGEEWSLGLEARHISAGCFTGGYETVPLFECISANVLQHNNLLLKCYFSSCRMLQQSTPIPAMSCKLIFETTVLPKEHALPCGDSKQTLGQGKAVSHCSQVSGHLTRGTRARGWRPPVCCLLLRCPLLSPGSMEAPFNRKRKVLFIFLFKHSSSITSNQGRSNRSPADRPAFSSH